MNKYLIILFIFIRVSLSSNAQTHFQNYIPNGSFDSIISTDFINYGNLSQQDSRWFEYASCGYGLLHQNSIPQTIPNIYYGYQLPQKGNGIYLMASAGNLLPNQGCDRECQNYIQIKLFKKTKNNKLYRGRFYVSLSDSVDFATSRIGMYISTNQPLPIYLLPNNTNPYISATPQIQRPFGQAVTDKINWTKIEGIFKANTNMQWMTLGNFYRISNTDTVRVSNYPDNSGCFNEAAGYYFDNLSLVEEDRAEAYFDTSKTQLCIQQGSTIVLGDTTERPWLQYEWRNKSGTIVGTNRTYAYNAALIENTFFTLSIKDTGEYAFITEAIDTIFVSTSISGNGCIFDGLEDVLKDAEQIDFYYAENAIRFNQLHERFTGSSLQLKRIDGKVVFKTRLERKQKEYLIDREVQRGFYFVEIMYENQSIARKKIIVE
jgi:hypothetical protein